MTSKLKSRTKILAAIFGLVLIGLAVFLFFVFYKSHTLTAGGEPIPKQDQAKAKAAGYYCPSWNAKPGQVAPDYCVNIDK